MTQEVKIITGIGLATLILVIATVFFLGNAPQTPTNEPVDLQLLTKNAIHQTGPSDAKVIVTEFADFQCPACANTAPVLKQLQNEYQGRVNFIYRHFPLPQHKYARISIVASEAAAAQGKFWEMSEILYAKQTEWSQKEDPKNTFISYAQTLGLNVQQFEQALNQNAYNQIIQTDLNDAKSLGINSTPTIYINNQKLTLPPNYQNLKTMIDQKLNN